MKTYTCDICKKQFGHNVSFTVVNMPTYKASDFEIDDGFYFNQRSDRDICNDCFNKIAQAQEDVIKQIINKNKND
jgi:hypothetical protein